MSTTISNILEGWGNSIKDKFGLLDNPELKAKSEKRLLICNTCSMRDNNTCSRKREGIVVVDFFYNVLEKPRKIGQVVKGCGCNLSAKSLCDDCQCPLGKWVDI